MKSYDSSPSSRLNATTLKSKEKTYPAPDPSRACTSPTSNKFSRKNNSLIQKHLLVPPPRTTHLQILMIIVTARISNTSRRQRAKSLRRVYPSCHHSHQGQLSPQEKPYHHHSRISEYFIIHNHKRRQICVIQHLMSTTLSSKHFQQHQIWPPVLLTGKQPPQLRQI